MHPRFNLTPAAPRKNETGITESEGNQGLPRHGGNLGVRFPAPLAIFRLLKRLHG
jgi:hypothetical protein